MPKETTSGDTAFWEARFRQFNGSGRPTTFQWDASMSYGWDKLSAVTSVQQNPEWWYAGEVTAIVHSGVAADLTTS